MICDPFETIFCSSDPFCTQGTRRRSANLSCAQVTPKERKILVRWVVQASECRKKRTFLKCWPGRQWWTSDVSGRGWKMASHGHGTSHPIYSHIPKLKPSYIFLQKNIFFRWAMGSSALTPTCPESTWGWPSTSPGLKESPERTSPDFRSRSPTVIHHARSENDYLLWLVVSVSIT